MKLERESIGKLRIHFDEGVELRGTAFWVDLELMDQLITASDDWHRLYNTERDSVIGHLAAADRVWLKAALGDTTFPQRRGVALCALIQLWNQSGRIAAQAGTLREAVKDDSRLAEEAAKSTASFEPNAAFKKMERDNRRRQYIREGRERQRLSGWTEWRAELLADPTTAFSPANLRATLDNLHKWLNMRSSSRSHYNVWDRHALTQAFGSDIAQRATAAFESFWRAEPPPALWSCRPPEERNSTPWVWIYGLCGVAAEATSPGWAGKLTPAEARTAAAYATVELNGFSSWLGDLAAACPGEVDLVLGAAPCVNIT